MPSTPIARAGIRSRVSRCRASSAGTTPKPIPTSWYTRSSQAWLGTTEPLSVAWLCESGIGASSLRSSESAAYTPEAPRETARTSSTSLRSTGRARVLSGGGVGSTASRCRRRRHRTAVPPGRIRQHWPRRPAAGTAAGPYASRGPVKQGRLCARCTPAMNGPGSLPQSGPGPGRPTAPTHSRSRMRLGGGGSSACAPRTSPQGPRKQWRRRRIPPRPVDRVGAGDPRRRRRPALGVVASHEPGGSSKLPCLHAWKTSHRGMRAQAIRATMAQE